MSANGGEPGLGTGLLAFLIVIVCSGVGWVTKSLGYWGDTYMETKVTVYPGPVKVDYEANRVTRRS